MTIFNLKQDLIIPFKGESYITFPKDHFALSYRMQPNYKQSYLNVTVDIVDLQDNFVSVFKEFTVTEEGFATGVITNIEDIHAWDIDRAALLNSLESTIDEEEQSLIYQQITQLGNRPQEQELFINKYSEVIEYFNNKGELTEQGIIWAKNLPQFKDII
jgi:hypothetical protein